MKQSFLVLRVILALVALSNVYFAYLFLMKPEAVIELYQFQAIDGVHQYLAMTVGALLSVFAVGALFPLVRPLKYGSIIIMLLLMHFSIFLVDVILLSRGVMRVFTLLPEMIYFLVISTALVRYYPIRFKEKVEPLTVVQMGEGNPQKEIDAMEAINEKD